MLQRFDRGYALLIGVGRSVHPEWSLPVTVRDVDAIKEVLTNPGRCGYLDDPRHIFLLKDEGATKSKILQAMDTLVGAVAQEPEATVLIYYSGHGWLHSDGRYFLIPHDAIPRALASTALPAERFIQRLRKIRAKRLLVVLDTCHAEGMAMAKAALPKGFSARAIPKDIVQELSQGSGRAVFTSCRGGESSWVLPDQSLSLFTRHFVEALAGAGSQLGDKVIRVSRLMSYVAEKVPQSARSLGQDQTPFFKLETEDFPVALVQGEKALEARSSDGIAPVPSPRGLERQIEERQMEEELSKRDVTRVDFDGGEIEGDDLDITGAFLAGSSEDRSERAASDSHVKVGMKRAALKKLSITGADYRNPE
jgi:hypothetical protein